MINLGKRNLLGVLVDAIDYAGAVERVLEAACAKRSFSASALAVHGVMTGALDATQRYRLNQLDLVVPDGQPVRWGLNLLHGTHLEDRVYGPNLMLALCAAAAREGLPIYLYGSRTAVLEPLQARLKRRFPSLVIAGAQPSLFRQSTAAERAAMAAQIRRSGAAMTFVGLGCPRQEIWAYEHRAALPMPVVAVGAAFDFHAGLLRQPPLIVQRAGLEWSYRLVQEPQRLWRRYLYLNPAYVALLALQWAGLWHVDPASELRPSHDVGYA